MLRHWQSQQRRINRIPDRRFIGIQGEGHAPVNAIVNWNNGNPEWLSLIILGGRLVPPAALPNSTVEPLANVCALPAQAPLHSDVQRMVDNHSGHAYYAQHVTPQQLTAINFEAPVLMDSSIHAHAGPVPYTEPLIEYVLATSGVAFFSRGSPGRLRRGNLLWFRCHCSLFDDRFRPQTFFPPTTTSKV